VQIGYNFITFIQNIYHINNMQFQSSFDDHLQLLNMSHINNKHIF